MRRLEHEYKLMGLAPYGEKYFNNECYQVFNEILKLEKYNFKINKKPADAYFHFKKRLEGLDLIQLHLVCSCGLRIL